MSLAKSCSLLVIPLDGSVYFFLPQCSSCELSGISKVLSIEHNTHYNTAMKMAFSVGFLGFFLAFQLSHCVILGSSIRSCEDVIVTCMGEHKWNNE